MKDINIGQFVNRFINADAGRKLNSTLESMNNQSGVESGDYSVPVRPSVPNFTKAPEQQQVQQTTVQLAQLNNLDKSLLIKELLNLPKEIKEFLLMMTSENQNKNVNPQEMANLLMTNTMDLSKVVVFMQQNGKDAVSKLFQMIANFNQMGVSIKTNELTELTTIINACIPTAGTTQAQTLKNLMLLYLPWLPLGEQNAFNLEIGSSGSNGEKISDDSVTILISTENFGNVQVVLFKVGQESINMQISCSKEFPKEEAEKALKQESKSYNIHTGIAFEEKESFNKEKKEISKTQVSLNTSPGVNPFLILMAHSVIKIIIGIDKSDSLRQTRKEMSDKSFNNSENHKS